MKVKNYKLYKPYGYLSQFLNNQKTRKNKKLLGEIYDFAEGAMAIGRLDEDSEGLLFITTCGKISEQVRSKEIEKEYFVQTDGIITPEAIEKLQQGIEINVNGENYKTLPATVYLLSTPPVLPERAKKIRDARHGPTSWISITLKEGKFRQVKKMTAAVGFPTLRLVRMRIGNECAEGMKAGEVIAVNNFSI